MGRYVDAYLPPQVPGYPYLVIPTTSTTITELSSGDEGRNQNWQHPRRKIKLPPMVRTWSVVQALIAQFYVTAGPAVSFPFRDALDYASLPLLVPNEPQASVLCRITAMDQTFGTGDGVTKSFQLTKTYTSGPGSYVRNIGLPITANLLIAVNGTPTAAYTVTRPGGVVTFTAAPAAAAVLTWGGLFDVPVRFDSDDALQALIKNFQAGGASELDLYETRLC